MEESKNKSAGDGEASITKTKINDDMNKFDVYGSIFNLPARYDVVKPLGSGAYGGVVLAKDSKKSIDVAIK